tara:strand:+ start:1762 stop:2073 length:312 start_codon:yes stop_codon:yes gene_type:complete
MSKYLSITLTTGEPGLDEQVSQRLVLANGVSYCALNGESDIVVAYYNGGRVEIRSASALTNDDAVLVQEALIESLSSTWSNVRVQVPALSELVNAVVGISDTE